MLLELNLPDSRSLDTIEKFCQTVRSVPALVMTGQKDKRLALSSLEAWARDYLLKKSAALQVRLEGMKAVSLFNEILESVEPFDAVILDLTMPREMGGKERSQDRPGA